MTSARDPERRPWPNEIVRRTYVSGEPRWADWRTLPAEEAIREARKVAQMRRGKSSAAAALPPRFLDHVGAEAAEWKIPERTEVTADRWRMLVGLAISRPGTLGIIRTGPGGLEALHEREFGKAWPWSTFSANVRSWTKTGPMPLVLCRYGNGGRRYKPVTSIEIPLLTETLIWAARQRMEPKRWEHLESCGLTPKQVYGLTLRAVRLQAWPPLDIEYPNEWYGQGGVSLSPRRKATALLGALRGLPPDSSSPLHVVEFERDGVTKSD